MPFFYDSAPGDAARNNRRCSRNRGVRCHIEDSLEHVVRIERVRSGGVLWRADSAAGDSLLSLAVTEQWRLDWR